MLWYRYPDADVAQPLLVMERKVKTTTVKRVEKFIGALWGESLVEVEPGRNPSGLTDGQVRRQDV